MRIKEKTNNLITYYFQVIYNNLFIVGLILFGYLFCLANAFQNLKSKSILYNVVF